MTRFETIAYHLAYGEISAACDIITDSRLDRHFELDDAESTPDTLVFWYENETRDETGNPCRLGTMIRDRIRVVLSSSDAPKIEADTTDPRALRFYRRELLAFGKVEV